VPDTSAFAAPRPRVVLGVAGGIAAYKAVEVLRALTETGHDVTVVPTASALRFVGAPTFAALSGHPVHTEVWDDVHEVPHVRLGQQADLVLVVPATADLLSRAAHGRADDLLTGTLLTARCPVVYAPAMHTEMWQHPATMANVATLRSYGAIVIEPAHGRLTGADTGPGRLPDPQEIAALARSVIARSGAPADLRGRRVVVTAGGTREELDPVRFLGNRSSGRQGAAIARAATVRGAEVTLVAAHMSVPEPAGAKVVSVGSALELREATLDASRGADVVVMAAAVADFRPAERRSTKIKKGAPEEPCELALVRNPDVLAELGTAAAGERAGVIVGFAAETDNVLENGRAKLARKGCDLLVVNEVGDRVGFEVADNSATILVRGGAEIDVPSTSKDLLAHRIWDAVVERLA
jgi:phosphopantothenoylcysteine decarboxylase/phosphopantothenate--cysteine ligase